jgi:hypothetical protein
MPQFASADYMRIFNFTTDDLAANRAGRLTAAQAQFLRGQKLHRRQLYRFAGIVLGIMFVAGLLAGGLADDLGIALLTLLIVGPLLLAVFLLARNVSRDLRRDAKNGVVVAVRGEIGTRDTGTDLLMLVGQRPFNITESQYAQLRLAYGPVTAYIAPESGTVLAVEPGS